MKLSIDTYTICQEWSLEKILEVSKKNGYLGVEFRCEAGQKHGVEPETTKAQRDEIKSRMAEFDLAVSCLSTSQRFDNPNKSERAKSIERSKQFIELARDIDCGRIRVFGNNFPPDVEKAEVIKYVGESLRELGEFAKPFNVDVLLEMHGQFYYWEYALNAVLIADHPNIAINYNCDKRDLVNGSVSDTYEHVKKYIRHVHMHDLEDTGFPYVELFQLLKNNGYQGFTSLELGYRGGDPEKVIALYAALYRAYLERRYFS